MKDKTGGEMEMKRIKERGGKAGEAKRATKMGGKRREKKEEEKSTAQRSVKASCCENVLRDASFSPLFDQVPVPSGANYPNRVYGKKKKRKKKQQSPQHHPSEKHPSCMLRFLRLSSLAASSTGLLGVIALGPLGRRLGTPRAAFRFRFSSFGLLPE